MYTFDTVNSYGLVNYFPIIDAVDRDIVGGKDPFDCYNVEICPDRFGVTDSALNFTRGYCKIPPSTYLNYQNGFTFTFWGLQNFRTDSVNFLSFYTDYYHNLNIGPDGEAYPEVHAYNGEDVYVDLDAYLTPTYDDQWMHHGVVFYKDGFILSYFLNGKNGGGENVGENFAQSTLFLQNYIGKNIGGTDNTFVPLLGKIDEIRFYNRALDQSQIQNDMNVSSFLKQIY